jgi:hypothetical protein
MRISCVELTLLKKDILLFGVRIVVLKYSSDDAMQLVLAIVFPFKNTNYIKSSENKRIKSSENKRIKSSENKRIKSNKKKRIPNYSKMNYLIKLKIDFTIFILNILKLYIILFLVFFYFILFFLDYYHFCVFRFSKGTTLMVTAGSTLKRSLS